MKYLEIFLVWFCYGWTLITFPGFMFIIALSVWASYDNEKWKKKLSAIKKENKDKE